MLKKLSTNKKIWIFIIILFVVILSVAIGFLVGEDSKETGKSNVNIENENDEGDSKDDDSKKESDKGELEVMEEDDGTTENAINAPNVWEGTTDDGSTNTGKKVDKTEDKIQEDSNAEHNTEDNVQADESELDEDIRIEDETSWGTIF